MRHAVSRYSTLASKAIRSYPMNGAWIGEMTWAPDSGSIYVLMNEGTFASGEHMFEMPIVRVALASGEAERVVPGAVVNYSMSVSRDGRTMAYRQVEPRTMRGRGRARSASADARRPSPT